MVVPPTSRPTNNGLFPEFFIATRFSGAQTELAAIRDCFIMPDGFATRNQKVGHRNNGMFERFNHRGGHYALLLTAGTLVFLVNLGGPSLWDLDEGRNATAAYEMMSAGEWIVPTFNSELRVDKPALLYWLQIIAYYTFGVCEFSARLPSALAALATLLVCYELGRRMFSSATGLLAGLILASSPMLCGAARFANPDALLNLFSALGLTIFWAGYDALRQSPTSRPWLSVAAIVGASVAAGFAVLAKGPVGVVLPGGILVVFLLWNRQLSVIFNRRLLLGVLAFVVVAGPWYVLVTVDSKGEFAEGFLLKHNVQRFASTMESHRGGPFYYPLVLLIGLAPWSVFLLSAVCCSVGPALRRRTYENGEQEKWSAYRFLWCWIVLYLLFFSLSATKLPNYILPVCLPAALLIGRFCDRWRLGELHLPRWHMPLSLSEIALIGVAICVGLTIASGVIELRLMRGRSIPDLGSWALIGLMLILGAGLAWWFHRQERRTAMIGSLAASALLTTALMTGGALAAVESCKAVRILVAQAGAYQPQREIIIGCLNLEHLPSFNFYCQRDIKHCRSERETLTLLKHPLPVYVFLPAKKWESLSARIRSPHQVLGRHRDIYKNDDIVVVTNRVNSVVSLLQR